jgi:hypothetical protein
MPTGIEFKDIAALLPLLGGIFTYFKTSHERLKRARRIARTYEFGIVYSVANIWPHWIYITATLLVMLSSIDYFAVKFFSDIVEWPYVGKFTNWIFEHYYEIFVAWLVFVVLAFFQLIERLTLGVFGAFRDVRKTADWANADWHIREDGPQAAILASSQAGLTKIANTIVTDLIKQQPNDSLALRPRDFDNADAANILYFGHVIEEHTTAVGGPRFPWTTFYEAMGRVATAGGTRPFSPGALSAFDRASRSFLSDVLMKMNDHVALDFPKLVNDVTLEQRVSEALGILQDSFRSDARNVARGWGGSSYRALLNGSRSVFQLEEIRRQFAKLMMLWNVVDNLKRPDAFEVPFSGGIFLLYLNNEVLLTESEKFERKDPGVQTCFERAQHRLMRTVFDLIESSADSERVAWCKAEKAAIAMCGADWKTWVFYRADQHSYHLGRAAEKKPWKEVNNGETFIKGKS